MTRRDFSIRDIHMALDGELPADEREDFAHWLETNPEMKALNARFAADRASRQYEAIDPANRLVAAELEVRWNRALERVARSRCATCCAVRR